MAQQLAFVSWKCSKCPFKLGLATNGWRPWQRNSLISITKRKLYINIFIHNVFILDAFNKKTKVYKGIHSIFYSIVRCLRECFYMKRNWNEHESFKLTCRNKWPTSHLTMADYWDLSLSDPLILEHVYLFWLFFFKFGYLRQWRGCDSALVGTWGSKHQPHSHIHVTSFRFKTKSFSFIPWLSKTLVKRLLEQHCNLFKRWQTLCLHSVKGHLKTALPCLSW